MELTLGRVDLERGNDVIEGALGCPGCGAVYPIKDGVAVLAPEALPAPPEPQAKYESEAVLGAYLWSQFGDLAGLGNGAGEAYGAWATMIDTGPGPALDAGCATGRMTLELAAGRGLAVGCDLSETFIRTARELHRQGSITARLKVEGRLFQEVRIELPERLRNTRAEFVVADASAMPFKTGCFACASALNLVDKMPAPLKLLKELDRCLAASGAEMLLASPFSWSEDVAGADDWLGGVDEGEFAGRAADVVPQILAGRGGYMKNLFTPGQWRTVGWTIRNHANHMERIGSQTLKARR